MKRAHSLLALVLGQLGCEPSFPREPYEIDRPRILAVVATPPEARPGEPVTLSALAASADGPLLSSVAFGFCSDRPGVATPDNVAASCVRSFTPVSSTALVPNSACAMFGSEPPPASSGDTPLRPFDPDATGGYYLPVRAALDDVLAFGSVRLSCALPQAPAEIARAFRDRYQANRNPDAVVLNGPVRAPRGTTLEATVDIAAEAFESYPVYNPYTAQLTDRVEELQVSYFATAAVPDRALDRVTRRERRTSVRLTLGDGAAAYLYVVVRDERGGQAFRYIRVTIL